jgi:leucyl aminopeptidase
MWGEEYTFWSDFLPFLQGNKTNAADLTNMGRMPSHASTGGGSNVAAHFLREFAVQPLIHIDIFASTWNWSGDYPGAHYGATGAPFNSVFQALNSLSV